MYTITKIELNSFVKISVILTLFWWLATFFAPFFQQSLTRIAEIQTCIPPNCLTSDSVSAVWINVAGGFLGSLAGGIILGYVGGYIIGALINLILKKTGGFKVEMNH